MVRNTVKMDNLDVRSLSVENEALLTCNFSSYKELRWLGTVFHDLSSGL